MDKDIREILEQASEFDSGKLAELISGLAQVVDKEANKWGWGHADLARLLRVKTQLIHCSANLRIVGH